MRTDTVVWFMTENTNPVYVLVIFEQSEDRLGIIVWTSLINVTSF